MPGRTDSRARLLALLCVIVMIASGMTFRLVYWQISRHDQLDQLAGPGSTNLVSVPAKRGTIYDRTGTVVLAETIFRYRIVANLSSLSDDQRSQYGDALTDYLNLTPEAEDSLRQTLQGKGYYVVVATGVDAETAQEIREDQAAGGLSALSLEVTPVRVYPQAGGAPRTSLAAQLLGFVNSAGRGQYGLEEKYDSLLSGRPEVLSVDPNNPGPAGTTMVDPGRPGEDVRTTIDAGLQLQLEQEVFSAWLADRAKAVSAMAMDPKTGALLAEATYPSYDANAYLATANQNSGLFLDPNISAVYEPGSVFKMLTASAALQTKTTALNTKINDFGVMTLSDGQEVADADRKAKGWMTFADIVAWSRNVGVSQAAFRLGASTTAASRILYQTWQTYGIGSPTGIDLAGEVSGIVRDPSRIPWQQIDLANASFGQGVAITPIQLLRAYAEMANGGRQIQPHVADPDTPAPTSATASSAASGAPASSGAGQALISSSLSTSLNQLMEHVVTVVPSYAQSTYVPGYFVAGKTGTAQIWDQSLNKGKGDWMDNIYNYSFYGWIGHAATPDVTIGVVIYQGVPTKVAQGVLIMPVESTDLFRRVATDAVVTLKIPANPNGPPKPNGKNAEPLG